MHTCITVARKELRDHLRDTRSVVSSALYALMGPVVVALVALSPAVGGARGSFILLSMASVFVLVSAFTGGMNVAMDTTAGERERRSLVPLLLTRPSWRDILIGKWIAASAFALGSLVVTLAAFAAALATQVPDAVQTIGSQAVAWTLLGLVPLALMGGALHLLVSARCRSTKEAQSWLMMAVLVPMMGGMGVVFFPGWAERWGMAVPIVGQQALMAGALTGRGVSLLDGMALAAATVACTAALLSAGCVLLNRDELLAG